MNKQTKITQTSAFLPLCIWLTAKLENTEEEEHYSLMKLFFLLLFYFNRPMLIREHTYWVKSSCENNGKPMPIPYAMANPCPSPMQWLGFLHLLCPSTSMGSLSSRTQSNISHESMTNIKAILEGFLKKWAVTVVINF
jgi:hypothetical protein